MPEEGPGRRKKNAKTQTEMKLEVEDGGHFSLDGASVRVLHIHPAVICEVGCTVTVSIITGSW